MDAYHSKLMSVNQLILPEMIISNATALNDL